MRSADALSAFEPREVHALALAYRSGYLPRLIGALMVLAGLCYLLDGFSLILSPAFHGIVFPFSLLPAFVAESALALWLLVKGVDVPKFERAGLQAGSP